jgi:hypothetical protein
MTRGFDERFYPRHVRTIHNPTQSRRRKQSHSGTTEPIPDYRNPTIAIIEHFKPPGPRGGREGRSF